MFFDFKTKKKLAVLGKNHERTLGKVKILLTTMSADLKQYFGVLNVSFHVGLGHLDRTILSKFQSTLLFDLIVQPLTQL